MTKAGPKTNSLGKKVVLHVITGSIAAYKAGDLITQMRSQGARVICILTKSAEQFVTPLTVRALSGEWVYRDLFAVDTPYHVLHTSLAETADVVLICPASANMIARLASGMADDLASCTVLATRKPVIVVPAMNDHMYEHPLTRANLKKLREIGYHIVDPIQGRLVCGKEAVGHVASNDTIIALCQKLVREKA